MRPFLPALRFAAALALLCSALPARADEDLGTLLRRGVALRREHRNEEALAVFQRAVALSATPPVLAQRGLAEEALSLWLDAARDLDAALAAQDDPWIVKNDAPLKRARSVVGQHLPPVADPPRTESAVTPPALPAAAPAAAAAPQVTSDAPPVAPATEPPLPPVIVPEPTRSLTGPLTLGAAGLLGLGAGTYFGIRTFDYKGDRDAQCAGVGGCKPAALTYDADARSAATTSTIAFGAGIACVVAGTAWWLIERGSGRPPAPIEIGPMIGQGRGLVIGGGL
jgi:hypothetical protein